MASKSAPIVLATPAGLSGAGPGVTTGSVGTLYAKDYVLDTSGPWEARVSRVRSLVEKIFGPDGRLDVSELKGGITNVLLQGSYKLSDERAYRFLIRAYGKGTSTIIDRDREFATHLHLQTLGLAPPLYARFGNGLVYGFIPGRSLHYTELSRPDVMVPVSNRLAQWHALLDRGVIQNTIKDFPDAPSVPAPDDLWSLLEKWIDQMPTNVLKATPDELRTELRWFRQTFGSKGPLVVAHCDLLSGNIIVPAKWGLDGTSQKRLSVDLSNDSTVSYTPSQLVTFIDYEYAMAAPRGFDLANHFLEWQGFDCKTELIPDPSKKNPVMRFWIHHYLASFNHFKKRPAAHQQPSPEDVDAVVDEIIAWWGMPGFYWGIWAAIQSTISEIDFDYAPYARSRMAEYYSWKRDIFPSLL